MLRDWKTKIWIIWLAILANALVLPDLYAENIGPYYTSPRSNAMGKTYAALADNFECVWLNPAGLALFDHGEVHYMVGDLEGSTQTYTAFTGNSSAFTSGGITSGLVDAAIGKDIYAHGQFSATMVIPYFGMGFIMDWQLGLNIKNQALPDIKVAYRETRGLQFAFGFPIMGGGRFADRKHLWAIGFAGKVFLRKGGIKDLSVAQVLDIVGGNKITLTEIVGNFGTGLGLDLGTIYSIPITRKSRVKFGATYLDVGDSSTASKGPSTQEGVLSGGVSYAMETGFVDVKVAYEYSHILQERDFRLKQHFGFDLDFPLLSLYGGINQAYATYGVGFDLYFFEFTAVSYAQETGSFIQQAPSRRYMMRFDVKFEL